MTKHPFSPNGYTHVVLDTCVLLPSRLSDVLFDLMSEKLYFLHWTKDVEQEFLRNWPSVHVTRPLAGPRRLASFQRATRHGHIIAGHHKTLYTSRVPARVDQNDKHLIAAALVMLDSCRADQSPCHHKVFVDSDNTKHLAVKETAQLGVNVCTAGHFLNKLFNLEPNRCLRAVERSRTDLKNPSYTKQQFAATLRIHKADALADGIKLN